MFDGHGGLEAAKFCERNFEAKLREQQEFLSKKDIPKALENTFLGLDRMLMTPKGIEALVSISKEHPQQTSPVERALRYHADSKFYIYVTYALQRALWPPSKRTSTQPK